ncbi:hypothetical protein [Malaciobacter marinus]|jgi:hypothetical protein|uniref:hypothetical protein n=1 Tax=Malaciobacter marinus TaxID=505249 RepID=UPI0009A88723|nr:hypothetical protein [Malaciobacter marinus]SKB52562.1 hypothetical protein SAMN06295997_11728 [Malaciobacter marinus]
MARKSPNTEILKLLCVRSGNECAFPNCNHPIFNDNGLYIAQLCHMNAANIGGQRYDENQSAVSGYESAIKSVDKCRTQLMSELGIKS